MKKHSHTSIHIQTIILQPLSYNITTFQHLCFVVYKIYNNTSPQIQHNRFSKKKKKHNSHDNNKWNKNLWLQSNDNNNNNFFLSLLLFTFFFFWGFSFLFIYNFITSNTDQGKRRENGQKFKKGKKVLMAFFFSTILDLLISWLND